MREEMNQAKPSAKAWMAHLCRWGLPLAAAAQLWFDPSNGFATAILWGAGLYALWQGRKTWAAWKNPVGLFFGLGLLTVGALVASAGLITVKLAADLVRLCVALGWPTVLTEARYFHPYLYTHPNVSSMMAGLCTLVFAARWLAGAPGAGRRALLALGLAVDLVYLVVLASRGPQVVFALAALAFPIVLLPGWRSRLAALALAALAGWVLWQAAGQVNPRFRDRTMRNWNNRDTVWAHAKMLADQRPVLGYGFGKKAFVKAVYENPKERYPLVPVRYPHAHQYWLMLYFQGGAIGFALWSLGWLALGARLARGLARAGRTARGAWRARLRARVLPALLATALAFVLVYGIGDFPDHVIRHAQFLLAGLAVAWSGWFGREGAA